MANEIRQRLRTTIDEIPEARLGEVLDFMEFLLEKEHRDAGGESYLDPLKDPILEFAGGISHGSLARDIDKELYGETP
jgi:hypothetical protein